MRLPGVASRCILLLRGHTASPNGRADWRRAAKHPQPPVAAAPLARARRCVGRVGFLSQGVAARCSIHHLLDEHTVHVTSCSKELCLSSQTHEGQPPSLDVMATAFESVSRGRGRTSPPRAHPSTAV